MSLLEQLNPQAKANFRIGINENNEEHLYGELIEEVIEDNPEDYLDDVEYNYKSKEYQTDRNLEHPSSAEIKESDPEKKDGDKAVFMEERETKKGESMAKKRKSQKIGCEICGGSTSLEKILLCDGCDGEFHTYCLKPPLTKVPIGDWYCPRCSSNGVSNVETIHKKPRRSRQPTNEPLSNRKSLLEGDIKDVPFNQLEWRKGPLTRGRTGNSKMSQNKGEVLKSKEVEEEEKRFVSPYHMLKRIRPTLQDLINMGSVITPQPKSRRIFDVHTMSYLKSRS